MKIEKEPYYERMNTLFKSPVVPERHQWRHKMLLTIFSRLSNDWDMTTMDEKIAIIRKIIASGESISMLLQEYKEFFSNKNEHIADVNTADWALADIMLSMSNRIGEPAESGDSLGIKGYGAALAEIVERMTTLIPDSIERSDWVEVLCSWADKYEISTDLLPRTEEELLKITELDLSNIPFTEVPDELGKLENLEELTFANNNFTELPHSLGNLRKLKSFTVNYYTEECGINPNQIVLEKYPVWIHNLHNLESLALCGTHIEEIESTIANCVNLKEISLSDSILLTSLPREINKLVNLTHLDVESTGITKESLVELLPRNCLVKFRRVFSQQYKDANPDEDYTDSGWISL